MDKLSKLELIQRIKKQRTLSAGVSAANFMHLSKDLEQLVQHELFLLHFDIMRPDFTNKSTLGVDIVAKVNSPFLVKDVHLMMQSPQQQVDDCVQAGAQIITAHIETLPDPQLFIDRCHQYPDILIGLAINPNSDMSLLAPYMEQIDYLLLLGIIPGDATSKISDYNIDKRISDALTFIQAKNQDCLLGFDGGVSIDNAGYLAKHGCHVVVSGSALFKDQGQFVRKFKQDAQ